MLQDVRGEPDDLDAPWFTEALEEAGIARGAVVTEVEMTGLIGTGQTGRNARFALTWSDPTDRPATLVGKFPSADPGARANAFANGTYRTEFAFYDSLAHTLAVRSPQCHVARFDDDTPDFVLIMEDLVGCEQGDQLVGLTLGQAALAVEQAVGLHAPRWGDPTLAAFGDHRPKGEEAAMMFGVVYQMMVEPFLARLGSRLDDDIVALVHDLVPLVPAWLQASDTPRTVVHLDFRPDNFMFGVTPEAPPLVVVDWQTATEGNAMMDLAYMISGSFDPATRASVERDLLDDYLTRMRAAGVDYAADTMWRDYRLGSVWGVVMTVIATVLAAETERGNDMLTAMGQGHGRQAIELDALALLRGT
jgi:hypothetical protein